MFIDIDIEICVAFFPYLLRTIIQHSSFFLMHLPCSSSRLRKDWVATEESFTEILPFLRHELPHINDFCFKTIFPYFSFFPKSTSTYPPLHVWKHCKDPWNPPTNRSKFSSFSPEASMHAAFRGHVTCLELLIESGAQVDPEVTICDNLWWVWGWLGEGGLLL